MTVSFPHSFAVVIGIDEYAHVNQLTTAVGDATRLATLLRAEHGYDKVFTLTTDVTKERLRLFFTETLSSEVGASDRLLLYFAGHGIALDGEDGPEGYLIPQDARSDDRSTFIAMTDLYEWLEVLPCRHLLVILDCCFAGAFTWYRWRNLRIVRDTLYQEHYERFIREPAWQVITSAAYDQEALDVLAGKPIGERGVIGSTDALHSPFASALFEALAGAGDLIPKGRGDGVVTATELYLYLRQFVEVGAQTGANHAQTPELWPFSRQKHGKGEYIFLVPGQDEPALPPAPLLSTENNPYRGLESYNEEHAELFFGRAELVKQLEMHVESQSLTVVLGASGTGKSSLVKAGLIPRLRGQNAQIQADDDTGASCNLILPPMRPGDMPLKTLADLLTTSLNEGTARTQSSILETIGKWLAVHADYRLLLVVDQCEELVTLTQSETERNAFLSTLAALLEHHDSQLRLILTLRSDFEPQFAKTALTPNWHASRFVTTPLNRAELREVIELPAARRVLFFEPPELVDHLIDEVIQTPGALPLLSFTLSELYLYYLGRQEEAQQAGEIVERTLTITDYRELGGVIGSLRTRADAVYDCLDTAHQATMQQVMLRMVAVEATELARRRVLMDELVYANLDENERVNTVITRLIEARLLVRDNVDLDGDGISDTFVEPAHDALVRAWDKLIVWRREAEAHFPLTLHRELTQAAQRWDTSPQGEKTDYLWDRDPRLPVVETVLWPINALGRPGLMRWFSQVVMPRTDLLEQPTVFNHVESLFVQASVRRRAFAIRRLVSITAGILAVLGVLVVVALSFRQTATYNEELAVQERTAKETAQVLRDQAEDARQIAVTAEAETQVLKDIIEAGRLAAEAEVAGDDGLPQRRLLLALEAINIQRNKNMESQPVVQTALRAALSETGGVGLSGHEDWVSALAFSPDGAWLATGGEDGIVRLWDMQSPSTAPVVLRGHADSLTTLAYSPDGAWLATGGADGMVQLWDMQNPSTAPVVLPDHADSLTTLAFSPNGRWLATNGGIDDPTVRLWDMQNLMADSVVLRGHENWVNALVFSPDSRLLATSSYDHTVRLWDMQNLSTEPIVLSHEVNINDLAYSPDGAWLATGGADGMVQLWDMQNPSTAPVVLPDHADSLTTLAFSPNGRWLATNGGIDDPTVRLWDMQNLMADSVVLRGHENRVDALVFSPDSRLLATSSYDHTVRLWDMQNLSTEPIVLRGHENWVNALVFSPDSRLLATSGLDYTARLWDVAAPESDPIVLRGHADRIRTLILSPDGRWLATGSQDMTARLWNMQDIASDPIVLRGHENWVDALVFSPDSRLLATAGGIDDPTVRLWDMQNLSTEPIVLSHEVNINDLAYSPDGAWLATGGEDGMVQLWDMQNPNTAPVVLPDHADSLRTLAFSPNGRWLATNGIDDPTVRLWDMQNLSTEPIVLSYEANINNLAFSPDGAWLATSSQDMTARLWNMQDIASDPIVLRGHENWVDALVFSPDSRLLATAGVYPDTTVRLWDVVNPSVDPAVLRGHTRIIDALVFSPDGRWLASGSYDNTIRLWDVQSPTAEPIVLSGHESGVEDLAFSPDGAWLATGSWDATVRLWRLTLTELAEIACRTVGRNLNQEELEYYFPSEPDAHRQTCPDLPPHPNVVTNPPM